MEAMVVGVAASRVKTVSGFAQRSEGCGVMELALRGRVADDQALCRSMKQKSTRAPAEIYGKDNEGGKAA
jgi:hypothetical protein